MLSTAAPWARLVLGSVMKVGFTRLSSSGTMVDPSFISGAGGPIDVAVDAGHVY